MLWTIAVALLLLWALPSASSGSHITIELSSIDTPFSWMLLTR